MKAMDPLQVPFTCFLYSDMSCETWMLLIEECNKTVYRTLKIQRAGG